MGWTDCAQVIGYRVRYSSIDGFGRADNRAAYGASPIPLFESGYSLVQ